MKIVLPSFAFTIEKWKWNDKYNIYVSNQGRIRDKRKQLLPLKIGNKSGYVQLKLENNLYKAVHRLVLETWKPIENMENLTIDHSNHNKRDNSLKNLVWMPESENLKLADEDLLQENPEDKMPINQLTSYNLKNPIIICGDKIFNSYNEVINFLIDKKKITNNNIIKKNIKNNIIKSIKQNKKYCNYQFELK